jgi:transcriptional regulator with XRE-family HTH domain
MKEKAKDRGPRRQFPEGADLPTGPRAEEPLASDESPGGAPGGELCSPADPQESPDGMAARAARPRIGSQVRRLRQQLGMTLTRVAERSGLNVGYLSQIENDKGSPSLDALGALARALDVPVAWLFVDGSRPPRVVRAAERRRWRGPGNVEVQEVDGGLPRDLRIVFVRGEPGEVTPDLHSHAGDEHHIVLSGRVLLRQGESEIELGPGDYLLWDANLPHSAEPVGDEPVELLIISHRGHREGEVASRR